MAPASKGTILEIVQLALENSGLREIGLEALRGILMRDPNLAVIGGEFKMQPIWELLESQEGFDPEAAKPPFYYVKAQESKLGGVKVTLPAVLETALAAERAKYAALCPVKREDVDKVFSNPVVDEVATSGERPSGETEAQAPSWTPGGVKPGLFKRIPRGALLGVSAFLVLASAILIPMFLSKYSTHDPVFEKIEVAEFAGEIPLTSAQKWAGEVHAVIADRAWFNQPEDVRREQMREALQRLQAKGLGTLIVEDDQKRIKASAQWMGHDRELVQVRFY